jgi:hypothetical protein
MLVKPITRPLVAALADPLRETGLPWSEGVGGGGSAVPQPPAGAVSAYRSGGAVLTNPASWADTGSLARNLAKTTNNPIAGISIDGMATVDFSNGGAALETATGSISQSFVVYLIVRTRTVASTQLMMDSDAGVSRVTAQVVATGVFRGNAGTNISTAASTLLNDTVYLLRVEVNGASSELQVGDVTGASIATSANIGATALAGLALGASNAGASSFQGDIAEAFIYPLASDSPAGMQAYAEAAFPSVTKYDWTPYDLMMTGDSLCVGQGSTDGRGSRSYIRAAFEPLADDIETGVRRLRFEGLVPDRCMSHSGVSGRPIPTLRDNIAAQLASLPDLCLILIGTNDCRNNGTTYDGTTTPAAYADMLTNAYAASPTTKFRCFTVPSLVNASHDANVDDLNSKLPAIIATAAGGGMDVSLHDLHAVIDVGTMLDADGVHLNDLGYAAKATLEESVIRAAAA